MKDRMMKTTMMMILSLVAAFSFADQPSTPAPETTLRGVITNVKGNALTMGKGKGLIIDISVADITRQGATMDRNDLAAGMRVRTIVTATKNSGALVASKVFIEGPEL